MNTTSPQLVATRVANLFERIHREQMAGLPLLNKALSVATLGFQEFEGRILGMLITPWMMSLVRFPGPQDDWQAQALGSKHSVTFPNGNYRFLINVIDELGVCQMHSLHSPMHPFRNQAAAVSQATAFMDKLLVIPPGGCNMTRSMKNCSARFCAARRCPRWTRMAVSFQSAHRDSVNPTLALRRLLK